MSDYFQLLYICILTENHKLRNKNINFGGPLTFEFDSQTRKLQIHENNSYIESFFHHNRKDEESIINITGIVGENGSGKSLLLQTITNYLSGNFESENDSFIIIYSVGKKVTIHCHNYQAIHKEIFSQGKYVIEEPNYSEPLKKFKIYEYFERYRLKISDSLKIVYYKNYLEPKSFNSDPNLNTEDLSVERTIWHHEFNFREQYLNEEKHKRETIPNTPTINFLKSEQIKNIVKLLPILEKNIFYDFKRPDELYISDYYRDHNLFHNLLKNTVNENINSIINDYIRLASDLNKMNNDPQINYNNKIKNQLMILTTLNALREQTIIYSKFNTFFGIPKKINSPVYNACIEIIDHIKLTTPVLAKIKNKHPDNRFELYINFIDYLNEMNVESIFDLKNENKENIPNRLKINIKQKTENINIFLEKYFQSYITYNYLMFEWTPELSAGEMANLNLFATFNSINPTQDVNNLIIMIDEGETNLHPELQRNFIFNLIQILPKIFRENNNGKKINIQIVFSTHSPFLLSDLPKNNIIFLENNSINSIGLSDHKQTFGANIHTLLADSFFMKNGLIGQFAKEKLNEVIDLLTGKTPFPKEEKERKEKLEYIRKVIEMTGEPIIRNKLMSLYREKINFDFEKRISKIEKDISDLKDDKNKSK